MKKKEPIQLLSTIQVAEKLGKTKQWVHWAMENIESFPAPHAVINRYAGWKREEVLSFKETLEESGPVPTKKSLTK
ncbi:putative DNA-binding transcriptional regulator AlpA [Priestia megaterium]|uniref:helix-turn-helix transcriptional regulator n=1 Tax=Priestia megaterium TaxID=1404 RepID=UPI0033947471